MKSSQITENDGNRAKVNKKKELPKPSEERVFGKELKNKNIALKPSLKINKFDDKKLKEYKDENIKQQLSLRHSTSFNNPEARRKISKPKKESRTDDESNTIRSSRGERLPKAQPSSGSKTNTNVLGIRSYKNNFTKVGSVLLKTCSDFLKIEESRMAQMEPWEIAKQNDPRYVIEYSNDIFRHLKEKENQNIPVYGYIKSIQKEINEKMRALLVDWLVEVQLKFKLLPETLFLTINLIDRYLSIVNVPQDNFQLLGISAMLIASKYEEIYAPEVRDFVHVCGKSYSKDQIIKMESEILVTLDFDILIVSPYRFLERFYFVSDDQDMRTFFLAQYILELSLLEYKFLKYCTSLKASASLYIARKILKVDPSNTWGSALQRHSGYKENELKTCARDFCAILEVMSKISLKAFHKKFSTEKYMKVAKIISEGNVNKSEENKDNTHGSQNN